jgi:hypothetical protein
MREMVEELVKEQFELKSYIEKSLPGRMQLEEHDRELLLSLKGTMEKRQKDELNTAEIITLNKKDRSFFARFFKKR